MIGIFFMICITMVVALSKLLMPLPASTTLGKSCVFIAVYNGVALLDAYKSRYILGLRRLCEIEEFLLSGMMSEALVS